MATGEWQQIEGPW